MMSIYPGVSQIYTPRHSVHLRYPFISVSPYAPPPASPCQLSGGGGGEKRIFPPQCRLIHTDSYMLAQSLLATCHLPLPIVSRRPRMRSPIHWKVAELTHNPQAHTQRHIHRFLLGHFYFQLVPFIDFH